MAVSLQKMLKQAGHEVPDIHPVLEINPQHPIIRSLNAGGEAERLGEWSQVLFDQAMLAEGGQLEDPAGFVARMNALYLAHMGTPVAGE